MNEININNRTVDSQRLDSRAMAMAKCMRLFANFLQAREVVVAETVPEAKFADTVNTGIWAPAAAMSVQAE